MKTATAIAEFSLMGLAQGLMLDVLRVPTKERPTLIAMANRLLTTIGRETVSGAQMFWYSLGTNTVNLTKVDPKLRQHIIFGEGFWGACTNYTLLAYVLRTYGIQMLGVNGGERNTQPWSKAADRMVDLYHRLADTTGEAPAFVLHSKAGQDFSHAVNRLEGLRKVIFVATPMSGDSRIAFRWLMEQIHGTGNLGPDIDEEALAAAQRRGVEMLTIASTTDLVVLHTEARLKGARAIVVPESKRSANVKHIWQLHRYGYESHAGLPLYARDIIRQELAS